MSVRVNVWREVFDEGLELSDLVLQRRSGQVDDVACDFCHDFYGSRLLRHLIFDAVCLVHDQDFHVFVGADELGVLAHLGVADDGHSAARHPRLVERVFFGAVNDKGLEVGELLYFALPVQTQARRAYNQRMTQLPDAVVTSLAILPAVVNFLASRALIGHVHHGGKCLHSLAQTHLVADENLLLRDGEFCAKSLVATQACVHGAAELNICNALHDLVGQIAGERIAVVGKRVEVGGAHGVHVPGFVGGEVADGGHERDIGDF